MPQNKIRKGGVGTDLIHKKLRYEMGDANVIDRYLFALKVDEDLAVYYQGAGAARDLKFSKAALESATSHIVLSQGYAVSSGSPPHALPARITSDLPPFLLSRTVFANLANKGKAAFKFEWSDEISEVFVKTKKQLTVVVDGKHEPVPVFHCVDSLHDCNLWVIDDEV